GQGPAVVTARRLVAVAVAAQVDRRDPVTERGQTGELVPPGPPVGAVSVQQHHQRGVRGLRTGHRRMQADAVGVDVDVPPGAVVPDRGRIRGGHLYRRPVAGAPDCAAAAAPPGRTVLISLTESIVLRGARILRSRRKPTTASTPAASTWMPKTIR